MTAGVEGELKTMSSATLKTGRMSAQEKEDIQLAHKKGTDPAKIAAKHSRSENTIRRFVGLPELPKPEKTAAK